MPPVKTGDGRPTTEVNGALARRARSLKSLVFGLQSSATYVDAPNRPCADNSGYLRTTPKPTRGAQIGRVICAPVVLEIDVSAESVARKSRPRRVRFQT